jgi:broad specificity phosphatase PhoE
MKSRLRFLTAAGAAWLLASGPPAFAQKAVVVVRHAEKVDESADPVLSPPGVQRAEALARILRSLDVEAIYVTQFQRTAHTAAPLAAALKLTPIQIHSDATPELVERIRKEHPDDVVLTVGHSNSVPRILTLFGGTEKVEIGPDEYDNLFVVIPAAKGPPTILRLRY